MSRDTKLKIITKGSIDSNICTEEFIYDHKKAISGEPSHDSFCVCRLNPNEYLKSILDLFDSDNVSYVFTNENTTYRNDDIIDLDNTDSIIITYESIENDKNLKYVKKILFKDQDKVVIVKNDDTILKIIKGPNE